MPSLLSLLKQPYPFSTIRRDKVLFAAGSGIFVACFLVVFQPFGIQHLTIPYKIPILLGYGAVTTGIMLFNDLVLQRLFVDIFEEERWTVGKHIVWALCQIFLIALGNTFYSSLFDFIQLTPYGFFQFIFITLTIGIFPVSAITLVHYIGQLKKHGHQALDISKQLAVSVGQADDGLILIAENEKDRVTISIGELLFILSSDNYATLVLLAEGKTRKELIRSSLSRLEGQITYPFVIRCHRSYIVNLQRVRSVSGNAQGYKLHLDSYEQPIPVARKYSKAILQQLRSR